MSRSGWALSLGEMNYQEGLCLQEELRRRRLTGEVPDCLIFLEHPPTITVGSGGGWDDLLLPAEELRRRGIHLAEVSRGGRATYHGPGQLVGYTIVHLDITGRDLHRFRWLLEEALIVLGRSLGIAAQRQPGHPGVWVGGRKLASLGLHIRGWVTSHGFALNVNPDLAHFGFLRPCGLPPEAITSLGELLGWVPEAPLLRSALAQAMAQTFDWELSWQNPAEIFSLSTLKEGNHGTYQGTGAYPRAATMDV